jgi:hypothetical protein
MVVGESNGSRKKQAAEKALNDTNGYVLNGKPMAVVSFLVNVGYWLWVLNVIYNNISPLL